MKRVWKYVCKYTPLELLAGFGIEPRLLNTTAESYLLADGHIHRNVCSYSRSIVVSRMRDPSDPIIMTSCCDSIERTAEVLRDLGQEVYVLNLPHDNAGCCGRLVYKKELLKLMYYLSSVLGLKFDKEKFYASFGPGASCSGPSANGSEDVPGEYVAVLGARVNPDLMELIKTECPFPVRNNTCTGLRSVGRPPECDDIEWLMDWYAGELLSQVPCMRMLDVSKRWALAQDPNLRGVIYNTVSFCDFYSYEYARLKSSLRAPILKIETDYTFLATGQLKTRLRAFCETLAPGSEWDQKRSRNGRSYYAGIDSGSTSTNVVILDDERNIVSSATVPTGARVLESARMAFHEALSRANLRAEDICRIVSTGYGRESIGLRAKAVTEITCHAKGAHFLNPRVRTIIDIGGQDSKVIRIDEHGNVLDFVMNDKCAAGTGSFIELMAQSLQLTLKEMSTCGLSWREDITISSMCSVFAQSEVVSLIASGRRLEDIVHGINNSIALRIVSMGKRLNLQEEFMMTGGVARNAGVVSAIEEKLGAKVIVPSEPEICGALGAALIACEG